MRMKAMVATMRHSVSSCAAAKICAAASPAMPSRHSHSVLR